MLSATDIDGSNSPLHPIMNELGLSKTNVQVLSDACLTLGFVSIVASIVAWRAAKEPDVARGERFGIFVGLWVPSFFILSNRLARKADEMED